MAKFGKKIIALFVVAFAIVFSIGCGGDGQKFAKTPEEEYDRICSLGGDGKIFDFSSVSMLQITQNVFIDSPLIRQNNNGSAAAESMLFQLDNSKKDAVSYGKSLYIESMFLPNDGDKISYNGAAYGYKNLFDYAGRQYTGGYEEYLSDSRSERSPDVVFRNGIKLFPREKLENISGGKSGRVFTITASVKKEELSSFFGWFESFYPFMRHKVDEEYKFYDGDGFESVTFQIKSTRTRLSEVSVSAVAPANPDAFGQEEKVTLNARTEFVTNGFDMTVPDGAPQAWK